jgi:hypothetical protein
MMLKIRICRQTRGIFDKYSLFLLRVKKATIVILALLYLGLTTGVVKNLHYCMGELSNVDYGYDKHQACEKCGMTEKDGCCNTEFKVVKLEDSHQWKTPTSLNPPFSLPAFNDRPLLTFDRYKPGNFSLYYHSPPDHRANNVYLQTGVLLI